MLSGMCMKGIPAQLSGINMQGNGLCEVHMLGAAVGGGEVRDGIAGGVTEPPNGLTLGAVLTGAGCKLL